MCRVPGSGLTVQGFREGFEFQVSGLRVRVDGLGFRT